MQTEPIYDNFQSGLLLRKEDFNFVSTRFEVWMNGRLINNGHSTTCIEARVIKDGRMELIEVYCKNASLNDIIEEHCIFDSFETLVNRKILLTVPNNTNITHPMLQSRQLMGGTTRTTKIFSNKEPFCSGLFYMKGVLSKVTFHFANPERLIEFYP